MKTIGFIGLGLIGGSIAKAIRKYHPDYHILAYNRSKEALAYAKDLGTEPLYIESLPDAKHIFSHIEWRMTGYLIRVAALDTDRGLPFIFAEKKQSEKQYAIPSAFRAYVKYMKEDV